MSKMGSVKFFESYIEDAMVKNGETTHQEMYRVGFCLFDLVSEGTFSPSSKDQLQQLLNLREAMNNISKRLISRWEETL